MRLGSSHGGRGPQGALSLSATLPARTLAQWFYSLLPCRHATLDPIESRTRYRYHRPISSSFVLPKLSLSSSRSLARSSSAPMISRLATAIPRLRGWRRRIWQRTMRPYDQTFPPSLLLALSSPSVPAPGECRSVFAEWDCSTCSVSTTKFFREQARRPSRFACTC